MGVPPIGTKTKCSRGPTYKAACTVESAQHGKLFVATLAQNHWASQASNLRAVLSRGMETSRGFLDGRDVVWLTIISSFIRRESTLQDRIGERLRDWSCRTIGDG